LAIAIGKSNSIRLRIDAEIVFPLLEIPRLASSAFTIWSSVLLNGVVISLSTSAVSVGVYGKARAWCHVMMVSAKSARSVKRIIARRCSKARYLDI